MQLNDTDPRQDVIAGNISFGPNAVDGYIDEDPVDAYAVYFVDSCLHPIGDAVARIPKRPGVPTYCCLNDAYLAEIEPTRIPDGSDRLVIVPLTTAGPMLVGELTAVISDLVVNETVRIAITSASVTSTLPCWSLAAVTVVAVASLHVLRRH